MRESLIANVTSVVSGSIAIAIACKITNSAWPLLGYLFIPRFDYYSTDENNKQEQGDGRLEH